MNKVSAISIIASVIVALMLFQVGHAIWPLYFFLGFGLLSLFAISLSRGAAMGRVAFAAVLAILVWGVWELLAWPAQEPALRAAGNAQPWTNRIESNASLIAVAIWLVGAAWFIHLGRSTALSSAHAIGGYFLGFGAFVLGGWGAWSILLLYGDVSTTALQWTVGMSFLLPLVSLFLLTPGGSDADSRSRASTFSIMAAVAVGLLLVYVITAGVLVDLVRSLLGEYLPRLVERRAIDSGEFGWMTTLEDWNTLIVLGLVCLFGCLILASAASDAITVFSAPPPPFYTTWLARVRRSAITSPFGVLAAAMTRLVIETARFVNLVLRFIGALFKAMVLTARDVLMDVFLRSLRYIWVPLLVFSLVSFVLIIVLFDFRAYLAPGDAAALRRGLGIAEASPRELWAEGITLLAIMLFGAALAFGALRAGRGRSPFDGLYVVQLGFLAFLLASVSGLAVAAAGWLAGLAGMHPEALHVGSVFWISELSVLALLAVLFVLNIPGLIGGGSGLSKASAISITVASVLYVLIALGMGLGPIVDQLTG